MGFIVTATSGGYNNGDITSIDASWTILTQNDPAFHNSAVTIFKKLGGMTAGDTITVNMSTISAFTTYAVWLDTQGQDIALAGTVGGRSGTSSADTIIPGVTTTKDNQIILVLASERTLATGTVVTGTTPTVTQDYFYEDTDASTTSTSFYLGHFTQATAGGTGSVDITYNTGSGNGGGLLLELP